MRLNSLLPPISILMLTAASQDVQSDLSEAWKHATSTAASEFSVATSAAASAFSDFTGSDLDAVTSFAGSVFSAATSAGASLYSAATSVAGSVVDDVQSHVSSEYSKLTATTDLAGRTTVTVVTAKETGGKTMSMTASPTATFTSDSGAEASRRAKAGSADGVLAAAVFAAVAFL